MTGPRGERRGKPLRGNARKLAKASEGEIGVSVSLASLSFCAPPDLFEHVERRNFYTRSLRLVCQTDIVGTVSVAAGLYTIRLAV